MVVVFLLGVVLYIPHTVGAEGVSQADKPFFVPPEYVDTKAMTDDTKRIVRITSEDYLLEGLVDEAEFFYEVPTVNLKGDNVLKLDVSYSELLLAGSSLTVYIDESPVYTAELKENETEVQLKIPLPEGSLKEGFHHVVIAFYGHIAENLCANEENPANWASILASSHYEFATSASEQANMLRDFPYPFIQNERDQAVHAEIVIPNHATENILNAAMQVAAFLANQTNNEQEIKIVREADVEKITSHLIAIGTPEQWDGIIGDVFTFSDVDIPASNIILHHTVLQLAETHKQLMFITAEYEELIVEKLPVITEPTFIEQLSGNSISVEKLPKRSDIEQKSQHSFKEMNIPSITVDGVKSMSQNYFYAIPAYLDKSKAATLHLKMKVSDTLFQRDEKVEQKEDAELLIYINEIPHSVAIDDLDRDAFTGFYDIEIPIAPAVLETSPYLRLQFKGNGLKNREICVPPTDDKWIYVDEESYLDIPMKEKSDEASFAVWPAPFVGTNGANETMILLPDEINESVISGLQKVMNNLGGYGTLSGIEMVRHSDVTEEQLQNNHLIILGDISKLSSLIDHEEQLLLQMDAHHRLDVTPYEFVTETSTYTSFIQPSIWKEERAMVVFSAVDVEKTASFVSEALLEFLTTNGKRATIVVENDNGGIFSNVNSLEAEGNEPKGETVTEPKLQTWVFVVFVAIVSLGLVLFIVMYRKQERSKRNK